MNAGPSGPEPDAGAPTVTVRGDAVVRAEPDEALLRVTLTALRDSPGAALADVVARSDALMSLTDALGIKRADRSTSGVSVNEEFDHTSRGRRSLGYRAAALISIRLTDPELIGGLIARATEDFDARIEGPDWRIATENPVRLEAARQAAADGRRKAQAYAEGVGAKLGRLIMLSEPDSQPMIRRAAFRPIAAAAERVPIEPGEHEVAASIHVTFALEVS